MPSNSYIFIIPVSPVFNKEIVPVFEKLTQEDSALLYEAMYLNHKDMLSKLKNYQVVCCFDERDKGFVPVEYCTDQINTCFLRRSELWKDLNRLIQEKVNQEAPNILLLFSDAIGITPEAISKYFNLLNYDDYNILAGRSSSGKVGVIGLNYYESRLFEDFSSSDINYDAFLQHAGKLNSHLFTVNGFLSVGNFEHFQNLYKILSKKESIEFCSHEIHEKFTHLFIEYKEFL